MHSTWRYCTSILLKDLNLKTLLIKLVDDVLRNLLPLEIGAEPLPYGGVGRGQGLGKEGVYPLVNKNI